MTNVVNLDINLYHSLLEQSYLLSVAEKHIGKRITEIYPEEAKAATAFADHIKQIKEPKWFKLY